MKTCSKCKEQKPLTDFRPDPRYRLGVHCHCNTCRYGIMRSNHEPIGRAHNEGSATIGIIDGSKRLAIRLNEHLAQRAKTPEEQRNYYAAANNLRGAG